MTWFMIPVDISMVFFDGLGLLKGTSNLLSRPKYLNVILIRHLTRFAGKKDRPLAEQALTDKSDGTFLIRESVNRSGEYALSVK